MYPITGKEADELGRTTADLELGGVATRSRVRQAAGGELTQGESVLAADALEYLLSLPPLDPNDGSQDWRLFLASLDTDEVNLDTLFPEEEDQEYQFSGSDIDDPGSAEEFRNDPAVHISRMCHLCRCAMSALHVVWRTR